ncbi:MAG: response regulator [Pseudolabrys sp.]|nr:response regulator [Pseudolabrys sp.]MBV9955260.1 response regulator [Pseudolabrys sp.]
MADAAPLPQDVLIVEDNTIIAIALEEMIKDFGVAQVRCAGSVAQALALIGEKLPDFAVLDVDLGDQNCFEIAEQLANAGVPFVFATGYGEKADYPLQFAAVDKLLKPYAAETLHEALAKGTKGF